MNYLIMYNVEIYTESELVLKNCPICTVLTSKEKKFPLWRQLSIAATKRDCVDPNGFNYSFEPLAPVPIEITLRKYKRPETALPLKKVTDWIFFNLWTQMGDLGYITMKVKLKIASSMLLKLSEAGCLTESEAAYLYYNLQFNVDNLFSEIMKEDLPF